MHNDFLDGFWGRPGDEKRIDLAEEQLGFGVVLFIRLSPQFLGLERMRKNLLERFGQIIGRERKGDEFVVAERFSAERFAGIGPFLAQSGEIGLELAAFVTGIEDQNERGDGLGLTLPAILDEGEGDLALEES